MYIGGLFHAENNDAEVAFRNALDLENRYNDKFELRPIVRRLDPSDSFAAEKMGINNKNALPYISIVYYFTRLYSLRFGLRGRGGRLWS